MNFPRTVSASAGPGSGERRVQERLGLRCPMLLFRNSDTEPVRAATVNISSKGIYWVSEIPFAPLERLRCMIFITPDGFRASARQICLDCQVEVVRMEHIAAGFGTGARIRRYVLSATGNGNHPQKEDDPGSV